MLSFPILPPHFKYSLSLILLALFISIRVRKKKRRKGEEERREEERVGQENLTKNSYYKALNF
jgi:hypothetical protein